MAGSFLPSPLVVETTTVYPGQGADIVMQSPDADLDVLYRPLRDQGVGRWSCRSLARESTASEPLVASVRNVEPQVYLLLQNEAESRCSTTDQISRPWSKSKRPITSSLLAGIASYLPAIPRNSRRSWTRLRSE